MTTPNIFCAIFHLAAHDAPQDMVLILLPYILLLIYFFLIILVFPDRIDEVVGTTKFRHAMLGAVFRPRNIARS
jgi:hypothetical protein